jgi:hypothetical protein
MAEGSKEVARPILEY